MVERAWLALAAVAWVVAGLNLALLFDLKATLSTLAALVVLTALALPRAALPAALCACVGPVLVFAAAVVQPLASLVALVLVLVVLSRSLRPLLETARQRWMAAAATAAAFWPPCLGLVSNSVVEVFCPGGGVEQACHGFYRVGTG